MNRIILIGNGFDLAHGINTSYTHFINDYWENTIKEIQKTDYYSKFENDEISIDLIPQQWIPGFEYKDLIDSLGLRRSKLEFKNEFLRIITNKKQELNWVDIENEYYSLLKNSFKKKNCEYDIETLNKDFNNVQKLLEIYLKKVEVKFNEDFGKDISDARIISDIGYKIYSDFKFKDFTELSINKKTELEYSKIQKDINNLDNKLIEITVLSEEKQNLISIIGDKEPKKDIRKLLISDSAPNYFNLQPEEILFLNFNYTFTEKIYSNQSEFGSFNPIRELRKKYIHIHGTTDKYDENDVIFGFGDEIDEDYKSIENLNNNIFLENIKSIKYLETDNYKQLLEFLNNDDYQIFIFGHSCGNSDRTLLSTLFEHKHCSSIKPFFHRKDEYNDNYSDIIRNITRNFGSKSNMRDKVVNKKYCESLS